MNLVVESPPTAPFALEPILIEPAQRFLLDNVSWEEYVAIGSALAERGNLRLTYDEGRLEFMSLSVLHEMLKFLLGRLIDVLLEELSIPNNGYGQMTHQRRDLANALEPDACYYIKNFEKVRGLTTIVLGRDPAPDLALEIDVASSSIRRMPIYEKLGVGEILRYEANTLHVYVLNSEGHYDQVERSPTFPQIPMGDLVTFVQIGIKDGALAMVQAFRLWVRQMISAANGT